MRRTALALTLALAGCGDDGAAGPDADTAADVCAVPDGTEVAFDLAEPACDRLSSYRFFTDGPGQVPNQGVEPYQLNSALFSDYAAKHRFLWLPAGTSMTWHDSESFAVPVGAVILKTFAYPHDLRDPGAGERLLETRLLVHRADGWEPIPYVWNAEQTEAYRQVAGDVIPSQWIDADGTTRENDYVVPNKNECKNCHEESADTVGIIGPKARHLNREHAYAGGSANQLQHLIDAGYLAGAPADPAAWPAAPVWDDPASGTVDERARAWLDINCAHCHNPDGAARTSGLDLRASQTEPQQYGVCKPPVAAGAGSGGRQYNIVPGQPDESILVYRLESTEADVMMPELGRRLVHTESVALVREWITAMDGDCGAP